MDTTIKRKHIIIAHSQGGLVARAIQRSEQEKLFDGLVTMHSPHGGAQIVNNTDPRPGGANMATRLAQEGCAVLTEPIIREYFNNIGVLRRIIGALTSGGDELVGLADTACYKGVGVALPFLFDNVLKINTPSAKEFAVGSPILHQLSNGPLHVVTAYALEQNEDMMWRTLHWLNSEPNDAPIFGASDTMEEEGLLASKNNLVNKYRDKRVVAEIQRLFWAGFGYRTRAIKAAKERDALTEAINWLEGVNSRYLAMIGAFEFPQFQQKCICTKYDNNGFPILVRQFDMPNGRCDATAFPGFDEHRVTYVNVASPTIKPSDGVVLVESALALPGTQAFLGNTNNHFQMRNGVETMRFLRDLYDGKIDPFFRLEEKTQ